MPKKKAETPTAIGSTSEDKKTTAPKTPGLKILAFGAENIKRLKVVTIHPKHNMVQISGENESGKSSVLDSIEWGLCGTSTLPSHPIRKGEATGKIQIHLAGELDEEYKITRFFNKAGNKLQIEGKNRETFKSPQQLLDSLMGKISFDPLAFLRMDAKKQLETLRGLVTLDVDIDALDKAQKTDYDERRQTGRDIDALKARLEAMPATPDNLPSEPIDVAELTAKLQGAHEHNSEIERAKREKFNVEESASQLSTRIFNANRRVIELEREIEELKTAMRRDATEEARLREDIAKRELLLASPASAPVDTSEVAAAITHANVVNLGIQQRKQREAIEDDLVDAEEEYGAIHKRMEDRLKERTAAISRAAMPVPKLSFGDGEVLYDELPFAQASNAVQIRVSVALAMASNPKIRVLRIKDGSLLDSKSMQLISEMADANNYQVWVERVESSGPVGIVMVDGEATGEEAS